MADYTIPQLMQNSEVGAGNQALVGMARQITQLGIGAAGLGIAARGVKGIGDVLGSTLGQPMKVPLPHHIVNMPNSQEEEKTASGPLQKLAQAAARHLKKAELPAWQGGGVNNALASGLNALGALKRPDGTGGGFLFRNGATEIKQSPAAMWALGLGIPAALYGGYKLTDKALDASRGVEQESELGRSKNRYEQALSGKVATVLNEIFDALEKDASIGDALAQLAGGYGIAATLAAGAGGVGAYNWARSHSEAKALDGALKQRRERLFMGTGTGHPSVEVRLSPGPAKLAALHAAVTTTLGGLEERRQKYQQQMAMLQNGGKPPEAPKGVNEPQPPQLPSVVNRPSQ